MLRLLKITLKEKLYIHGGRKADQDDAFKDLKVIGMRVYTQLGKTEQLGGGFTKRPKPTNSTQPEEEEVDFRKNTINELSNI